MAPRLRAKSEEKQDAPDSTYERAKAEIQFADRLLDILKAFQDGTEPSGRPGGHLDARVDGLTPEFSRLYNRIWDAALNVTPHKTKKKKGRAAKGEETRTDNAPTRYEVVEAGEDK